MLVHRDLSQLPPFRKAVVTIGTFDGVHAGHRKIIEQLKKEAADINGETVIITFHPHPRRIVREGQMSVPILTTLPEKCALLELLEIDHLVVIPFDEAFASQSAEEYIQHFLWDKFHPHTIIIGYDHKFGKGRSGDYQLLEKWGETLGFFVKEIPEKILDEIIVSSTKIREALLKPDIETGNHFLTYPYFFQGIVVKGNQLGRTIGYPTANVEIEDKEKLIPGNGIFAVEVSFPFLNLPKPIFGGMMSIGMNPTVNGTRRTIEVNIFEFAEDVYGQKISVHVKHYLRAEEKFNGLEALTEQLAKDKENSLRLLSSNH